MDLQAANGLWHEMNDSHVSVVSLHTVLNCQAYILFYSRSSLPQLPKASSATATSDSSAAAKEAPTALPAAAASSKDAAVQPSVAPSMKPVTPLSRSDSKVSSTAGASAADDDVGVVVTDAPHRTLAPTVSSIPPSGSTAVAVSAAVAVAGTTPAATGQIKDLEVLPRRSRSESIDKSEVSRNMLFADASLLHLHSKSNGSATSKSDATAVAAGDDEDRRYRSASIDEPQVSDEDSEPPLRLRRKKNILFFAPLR